VPTFYFDVQRESTFLLDKDGVDLPDMPAAEREAAELAITIARETLRSGEGRVEIQVRNAASVHLLTASVTLEFNYPAWPDGVSSIKSS